MAAVEPLRVDRAFREGDLLTGLILEDRYRIGRRIGRGASGSVYEARSLAAALADHGRRRVAIKVLDPDQARDQDALARFTHEAFLGARLRHAGIVRVLDYGTLDGWRPYYAMELCRGAALDRLLLEAGALPRDLTLELLSQLAQALGVLHRFGVVHRDVKPANVFVELRRGRAPRARLLDLGVAGVFDGRRARKLGAVDVGARGLSGTPSYVAPEQALGLPTDGRADVYALACLAYRLLTGAEPFRGATVTATLRAHLYDTPRAPSTVLPTLPAAVDAVFERGLEKDPQRRTPSAERFVAELRVAMR